jgi:hypothetical protein
MPVPWHGLQQFVDETIDGQWGERVEFHPWKTSEYSTSVGDGADTSRNTQRVRGVFFDEHSEVDKSQEVSAAASVSVADDSFDITIVKQADRVYLPDRGWWFEVLYVPPQTATRRVQIQLTRMKDWE